MTAVPLSEKPLPVRHRYALQSLLGITFVLMLACTSKTALETVTPPEKLDELGVAVRSQFQKRWQAVHGETSATKQTSGAAWGALGQWYQAYKYPDSAEACYRNAMALDATEAKWPFYLGILAFEAGDFPRAKTRFEHVLQLRPELSEAHNFLGNMANTAGDFVEAEAQFLQVLQIEPDQAEALFGLGKTLLAQGDATGCVAVLEPLLDQQPDASLAHYLMGTALTQLGEKARAASHFEKVPEENDAHVQLRTEQPWTREVQNLVIGSRLYTRKGFNALQSGNYPLAARFLEKAVVDDPKNPEVKVNYAIVLEKVGRLDLAIAELEAALLLDPDNLRANLVLGKLGVTARRFRAAEKHLARALAIDPNSPEALIQMGRLRNLQGRLEDALTHYGRVRDMTGTFMDTRFWYAAITSLTEGTDKALQVVDQDLVKLPQAKVLGIFRCRLLATQETSKTSRRERLEAAAWLDSLDHNPDVFFSETRAMVAASLGDIELAVAWQKSALDALETLKNRHLFQLAKRRLALYERGESVLIPWVSEEAKVSKPVEPPQEKP